MEKCGVEEGGGRRRLEKVRCLEEERRGKRKETANDSDKQQTAFVSRWLCLWISHANARRCHRRDLHQ